MEDLTDTKVLRADADKLKKEIARLDRRLDGAVQGGKGASSGGDGPGQNHDSATNREHEGEPSGILVSGLARDEDDPCER
ncbi:unnamed protein product [Linum trigynum]|uniref:Uncharacterized protein n=1 Tax=Linum trigynum TaxID=586398 RepID=A0AAV2E5F7_9ROSI